MKKLMSITAAVLFLTLFFVPTDDAPLKVFFLWAVYDVCIIWVIRLIWQRIGEEEKPSNGGKFMGSSQ